MGTTANEECPAWLRDFRMFADRLELGLWR
jgi:hypothetical protein